MFGVANVPNLSGRVADRITLRADSRVARFVQQKRIRILNRGRTFVDRKLIGPGLAFRFLSPARRRRFEGNLDFAVAGWTDSLLPALMILDVQKRVASVAMKANSHESLVEK